MPRTKIRSVQPVHRGVSVMAACRAADHAPTAPAKASQWTARACQARTPSVGESFASARIMGSPESYLGSRFAHAPQGLWAQSANSHPAALAIAAPTAARAATSLPTPAPFPRKRKRQRSTVTVSPPASPHPPWRGSRVLILPCCRYGKVGRTNM
jgi:hypothetical protein